MATDSDIRCPHYQPPTKGRRCRHYRSGGGCARSSNQPATCVEWLKVNKAGKPANATKAASAEPAHRDLFGNPIQPAKPRTRRPVAAAPRGKPSTAPSSKPSLVRNITDEEVASFKALGVEVRLHTDALGDVYLVPAYTGQDRKELSIEHSITLTTICAAFPGAKVVALNPSGRCETSRATDARTSGAGDKTTGKQCGIRLD